jgi:capsular exopolysaccharide synthesis family protein
VLDLRDQSIQYNILKRQADTDRSLYDSLLAAYNQLSVSGSADTPQAAIIDRGLVPDAPFTPNIPRNLLLGLILGMGGGGGLAFALHFLSDTITTPDDVRDKLKLPPIGVIPKLKRNEEFTEALADRKSSISEAFASLVTTLQFTTSEGMPQVLLVTSSVAQEGKSSVSLAIARTLAHNGKRVLLVDADLRKPSFVMDERADIGLSRLIVDGSFFQRHVLKTSEDRLWVMPSGPMPPSPVQVLNSEKTARIIDQARQLYDYVIVDAPPVFGFADPIVLAKMCDGVMFVVESGRTRRSKAIEMLDRLRASGVLIVGAALNKYRFETGNYGYYQAYSDEKIAHHSPKLAVELASQDEG